MRKAIKLTLILFIISLLILPLTSNAYGTGVGVTPSVMIYTITSEEIVTQAIWVVNTGDVRTSYDLYFDEQYQLMFTFDINGFELDPDENQQVNVSYDPSQNPTKDNLDIDLYIKGMMAGSILETGIKVQVLVNHDIGASSISGHYFPLDPHDPEITNALEYLSDVQDSDGSIGGFSISCWATMAITSAEHDPHDWGKSGNSVVEYLINNKDQIDENMVTDIAKFILAMTAANEDPRNVVGTDYVSLLEGKQLNGQFGDESMYNDDFWAIMALISANVDPNSEIIQDSASFIKNHQNSDGGWSWSNGESDADDTSAAIMALIAAGEDKDSSVIINAIDYLKTQLASDGGFNFMEEANSASNSWAIMALVVAGLNSTDSEWIRNEISPVDHLLNLQNSDGSFSWIEGQGGSEWWTAYAIPALLGKPYPITPELEEQTSESTPSRCFIATASYGSEMASEVAHMRHIRDNMIGSNELGKLLVDGWNAFYYLWSPPIAKFITIHAPLLPVFRLLLLPLLGTVHVSGCIYTLFMTFNPTFSSAIAFLFAALSSATIYIMIPMLTLQSIYRKKFKHIRKKAFWH